MVGGVGGMNLCLAVTTELRMKRIMVLSVLARRCQCNGSGVRLVFCVVCQAFCCLGKCVCVCVCVCVCAVSYTHLTLPTMAVV